MFSELYSTSNIDQNILSKENYHPYPTIGERSEWESLPIELSIYLVSEAEKYLSYSWPELTAKLYKKYSQTGNRRFYEDPYQDRRRALVKLVIGECVENKGRFMNDIYVGILKICEESSWVTPSHVHMLPEATKESVFLNDDNPFIDLFAAETGNILSWIYYLIKPSLENVNSEIIDQMVDEVKKRILNPYLTRDDFWWMGLVDNKRLNNWTPWCTSNCLNAFLFLEPDQNRRKKAIQKSMKSIDKFVHTYHDDGGCDEGPGYWNKAGGSLYDYLGLLETDTNRIKDIYSNSKVQNIAKYIRKVHIHNNYFVNIGDTSHKIVAEGGLLYRLGKKIGDEQLMMLGAHTQREFGPEMIMKMKFPSFLRIIPHIFNYQEIQDAQLNHYCAEKDIWLDGIELMVARGSNQTNEGLCVVIKGGHNHESHNHNDVGNVIVYLDGQPILIDVGVETYTAKTFSDERYSIWTMRSSFHNVPMINGIEQRNGEEYYASNVKYRKDEEATSLSMNLARAYPRESNIEFLKRDCTLRRDDIDVVEIIDHIKFNKGENTISFIFMTCNVPIIKENGVIWISNKNKEIVQLEFEMNKLQATYERLKINDQKLHDEWGDYVYKIYLQTNQKDREDMYTFRLKKRVPE